MYVVLTGCFAEVIRGAANRLVPLISECDEGIADVLEVAAGGRVRGIDPFDGIRVAKVGYTRFYAWRVGGGARHIIVDQASVICPTVDHQGHEKF